LKKDEKEHLEIAQEGINQIDKIVKDLLDFARVSKLNLEYFPISQIIEEAIKFTSDALKNREIIIEKKFQPDLPLAKVDVDKMRQVFINILLNSIDAIREKGKIKISAHMKNGKYIKIKFVDNGCGIEENILPNIFEPFFTTKASGTGLGLANAKKIIEQHNGVINVHSKIGEGTAFEILIPKEIK
jgi:signal transduction histidine kinase